VVLPPSVIQGLGRLTRGLQQRNLLGRAGAGAVKRVAATMTPVGRFTYRDGHGYVVEADLTDYMERAGFFGVHGTHVLRLIRSLLAPGDWAIDVGANVGLISAEMCSAVGPEGRVWAIEPLPRNVERLEQFKAANRLEQLTVFPGALSEAEGTATLRLPVTAGSSGWGSLLSPWETGEEMEVTTWRLDDLVERFGPGRPPKLLKIDVEGVEPEVVVGAARTLADFRPLVICEFNQYLLHRAGTSAEALLRAFADHGYRPRPPLDRPRSFGDKAIDVLLVPV
jgi:FkbM family methyltransferase